MLRRTTPAAIVGPHDPTITSTRATTSTSSTPPTASSADAASRPVAIDNTSERLASPARARLRASRHSPTNRWANQPAHPAAPVSPPAQPRRSCPNAPLLESRRSQRSAPIAALAAASTSPPRMASSPTSTTTQTTSPRRVCSASRDALAQPSSTILTG